MSCFVDCNSVLDILYSTVLKYFSTRDGKTGVKLRDIFYVGDITGLHNGSFLAELCSARTRVENYTQYALSTLRDDSIDAATFRRSALQNVE